MWRYAAEIKKPLRYENLPFHHFPYKEGNYYGVNIKTNSMGFRDYEYDIKKPLGKKRIVVLGDSFTLGWGVPFNDLFTKQLERMINQYDDRVEVINLGTGNYNSIMEVELFKLKGLILNPDLVILMYFINDAEPIPRRMTAMEYFFKKHSFLFGFLFDRFIKLKIIFDRNFDWRQYYRQLYDRESDALRMNKKSLIELCKICREQNIRLLIVNIPELHRLKEYPFAFVTNYIQTLADEEKVPFVDLLSAFADCDPQSLWVSSEDPHANSKANSIIATEIYKKIGQDMLF